MTDVCKKILEELDEEQWDRLALETGIDMIGFLDAFDVNNESSATMLGHFLQSAAHFLRADESCKMRQLCRRLVLALTELGDAEDTILNLTEEIEFEEEADTNEVIVLLECVKIAVGRLPENEYQPVTWCFSSIIRHINNQTELPDEHNLEGREKMLLDSDPNVRLIESLYAKIIDFIKYVIDDILPNLVITTEERDEMNESIVLFLLKLLGKPLAYMDLEIHGKETSKSLMRSYSETIIRLISLFRSDLLRYLNSADCESENADDVVDCNFSYLSLGVLYYLIFHEKVDFEVSPKVYCPVYIFQCVLEHSLVMLKISSNLVQRKGLFLCLASLEGIGDYCLRMDRVDRNSLSKVSEVLPAIMVYSEIRENRQLAVKIFKLLIFKLDAVGRYTILLNIPKVSTNSGFVGYVTTIVKDIVAGYLSTDNQKDRYYFCGKLLADILKNLARLPQGVETDIAENSDSIISVLNFLRYLTIRDKKNETGIWDSIGWIGNDFLIPLKKAIDLSKAHYELEMKNTEKGDPQTPVSLAVGKQTLPNLTDKEKRTLLNNIINTFSLVDSLRARVMECIEAFQNSND